jgi:hypothetical protein
MSKKHFMKNLRRSCLSYTHYSFPLLDRHIIIIKKTKEEYEIIIKKYEKQFDSKVQIIKEFFLSKIFLEATDSFADSFQLYVPLFLDHTINLFFVCAYCLYFARLLHADDLDLCFDFFYERVRKDYFLR